MLHLILGPLGFKRKKWRVKVQILCTVNCLVSLSSKTVMAPSALLIFFLCSCVFLLLCPNLYGQYLPAYNIAPRWVLPVLLWLTHLPFIFFFAFVIFFPLLTVVSHLPASGSRSVSLSSASNFTTHPQELNLTHTRLSWQNIAAFPPSSTTSLMGKGDSIILTGAHVL